MPETERVYSQTLVAELSEDGALWAAMEMERGVVDVESIIRDGVRPAAFGCSAGVIVTLPPA